MTLYNAAFEESELADLVTMVIDDKMREYHHDSTRESQLWVIRALVLSSFSTLAIFAGVIMIVISR